MSDAAEQAVLSVAVGEALAAWHGGDPDAVPSVSIRAAYRELNCSMTGVECYRRVRYPGALTEEWPDAERLPALGSRAAERRCESRCEVPIGTIVVDFDRRVFKGKRGRCSVMIGIVTRGDDGKGRIEWCDHRTLRARPVYEATLPDGTKLEIARRERG